MIRKSQDITSVVFSVRVYQLLLNAYPTKFQQEYGSQMVQVFQDCCLRALRQGGTNGMVKLWAITLLDLIQSIVSEHMHKETDMSKSQLIRFSGWAFILGSFSFATILSGSDPLAIPGSVHQRHPAGGRAIRLAGSLRRTGWRLWQEHVNGRRDRDDPFLSGPCAFDSCGSGSARDQISSRKFGPIRFMASPVWRTSSRVARLDAVWTDCFTQ